MTAEEERVLTRYLLRHGEIESNAEFTHWYMQRFEDLESEIEYKKTLEMAQTAERVYRQGLRFGRLIGQREVMN